MGDALYTIDRFDNEHGDITLHVCRAGQTVCAVDETLFEDRAQAYRWAKRIVNALTWLEYDDAQIARSRGRNG